MRRAFKDVALERERQDAKHPDTPSFPDGTDKRYAKYADKARSECDLAVASGEGTWRHVLAEEVLEAFAEEDVEKLRNELVQVAAVAVRWVEALDER